LFWVVLPGLVPSACPERLLALPTPLPLFPLLLALPLALGDAAAAGSLLGGAATDPAPELPVEPLEPELAAAAAGVGSGLGVVAGGDHVTLRMWVLRTSS
jgi:hypothetical protein